MCFHPTAMNQASPCASPLGSLTERDRLRPWWEGVLRLLGVWLLLMLLMLLCANLALVLAQGRSPLCEDDGIQSVRGGAECLVVHVAGQRSEEGRNTLLVFIHGDNTGGGPSDPYVERGARYAAPGTLVVSLIRPGYHDRDGRQSSGQSFRLVGDGYPPQVVDAVAGAIGRLKTLYKADDVVLAGVSGGAAISGVILGRYPRLARAAVLSGCPCDVQGWRDLRGSGRWSKSLSPHMYLDEVPKDTLVLVVTGSRDQNTFPVLGSNYNQALQQRGVHAEFMLAEGDDHAMSGRSKSFHHAIQEALDRVRANN